MKDVTKLGNIADIYDGPHATPKKIENGKYFLSISSLDNGSLDLSKSAFISDKDFIKWTKRVQPQKGDLLFSYETRLGEAALMPDNLQACLGRRMGLLRPKKDKVIPQYLLFAYLSPEFQKVIRKNTIKGATVDRIALNELGNFPIYIPDLKTQQSIAAVLSALDKKIALNKQINARLEEMAKTLYDYWFVQFDFPDADGKPYKSSGGEMVFDETLKREIPKGWEVKSLGEVISLERGVTYSKDSICNDENGTGVLRATNISGNNIDLNDLIYISGEVGTQQKLKPFDILIVMSSGSKEHIGKNGVYYFEQDNAFGAFCSKITPKKVFFEFVSIFLQSNNFRNYVKNQCLGTNINNLNNSHILHCPIVRPNDEYIEVFHKQIKLIYEKISCNVKQNHQLTQLRDFLLPMLMNGQVSVAE
nr:restriction endonuclease subunit S [uncultured Neisseria sp.]